VLLLYEYFGTIALHCSARVASTFKCPVLCQRT